MRGVDVAVIEKPSVQDSLPELPSNPEGKEAGIQGPYHSQPAIPHLLDYLNHGDVFSEENVSHADFEKAEQVAVITRFLLDTRGWCFWKCSTFGGDRIAVLRDQFVEGSPENCPAFTEGELRELCQDNISKASLRLILQIKKSDATVVSSRRKSEPRSK
jgi:hypothetical protein